MQTGGKRNINNKKTSHKDKNKDCLKDNPVLHLSTTHIIMTAGRCTFWGCDRTR